MTDRKEILLSGGHANVGQVSRVTGGEFGDSVRRPAKPQTATVHAFLRHLRACGIDEVAAPFGFDDEGREALSFIVGETRKQSHDGWDFPAPDPQDANLIRLAKMQKRLHDAARTFSPDAPVWGQAGDYFPAGATGTLPCHNDLCISNVLFDESDAISGVIDFDYLHPVDRRFDIAVALRHWLPVAAPEDQPPGVEFDHVTRFHAYCDIHELTIADRAVVVDLICEFLVRARSNVANLAAAGAVGFQQMIANGYDDRIERTLGWVDRRRADLLSAAT